MLVRELIGDADFPDRIVSPDPAIERLIAPADGFAGMTFPRFRPLLSEAGRAGLILLAARSANDEPAGLLVAEIVGRIAMMHSLFVTATQRRRGIARGLLDRFARTAAAEGAWETMAVWTTKPTGFAAFEATLAAAGWLEPQLRVSFCEGDPVPMAADRWFRMTPDPQPPYAIAPWSSVSDAELDGIRRGDPAAPEELSPFFRADHIEPQVSRVLRCDGRIVGWSLVHDLPERPDALVHSRSWSHADHRQGARGLATIVAAVQAQVDLRPDRRISIFDVPATNILMQRVYEKRIRRFGSLTYESRQSGRYVGDLA